VAKQLPKGITGKVVMRWGGAQFSALCGGPQVTSRTTAAAVVVNFQGYSFACNFNVLYFTSSKLFFIGGCSVAEAPSRRAREV
jgi:hypothetical protein